MSAYLEELLQAMRPAFSRKATFIWFVIAFAGLVARTDAYGVSSIVRALFLTPASYPCLLHFFHSAAWSSQSLCLCWWNWLIHENIAHRVDSRIVMLGDHTKTPKDGRKIPAVSILHQDSETAAKPSFFRGHDWACIGLLAKAKKKAFALPLWAEIHHDALKESRATRLVAVAVRIAEIFGHPAYLVLDAFFSSGPVFLTAAQSEGNLHILTRAKKNFVAYLPPVEPKTPRRGRKRKYGEKLELIRLFETSRGRFRKFQAHAYDKNETVKCLTLDLLWKPTKGTLRFFLIETSRGRIILMTSDLTMTPQTALSLYCHRVTIETLFDTLKNLLGTMHYHFWSRYLKPRSRRPSRKKVPETSSEPAKTQNTFEAIDKFVHLNIIVLGAIQLLRSRFANEINSTARCWLRTPCGEIPSEFVTRTAMANLVRANLCSLAKDSMTQFILRRQISRENTGYSGKAA